MEISKLISDRRKELGLTLEEVGKIVGVSKSTVKKWEDGYISNMKRDKIALLAKALKLNPVVLITGEEDSDDDPQLTD
ncbi:MAG: helix-turn-helix domain-containing protein, partial [Ruminococcus sp.]|nr:helix-turn-helix domain-containing protein [Ruminococcus sp.]